MEIGKTLDTLLRGKTSNGWLQLFRYLFVGGAAFVVDFGSLYLLTKYAGLHYTLSATLSFILGLIVNYLLSIRWVFSQRKLQSRSAEFIVFAIIGIVGLGLNVAIIWFFTEHIRLHYLVSKIVATVLVFLWNFAGRKFILFDRGKRIA